MQAVRVVALLAAATTLRLQAVCAAAGTAAPPPAGDAMNETLRAAAARIVGVDGLPIMFIGSQFKGYAVQSGFDERYRDTHSRQYSLSTVGNDCKWQSTHSSPQGLNLTACVSAKLYADSVEQAFRGHNLCWGNDNPRWLLNADFSADQLRATLREHVTGVMRGVASETGSAPLAWDVVNEACGTAISANGSFFKPSLWYPKVPDFVDVAFIAARKAAAGTATQLFCECRAPHECLRAYLRATIE
jgi:endo-1,4-beta-xylanase